MNSQIDRYNPSASNRDYLNFTAIAALRVSGHIFEGRLID